LKKIDFIIVGSGISGVALALQLAKRNFSFKLFSDPTLSNSSLIAAGMWNPIVFKRITKSWMADELVSYMEVFYTDFEKLNHTNFFKKLPLLRQFSQPKEIIDWNNQRQKNEFENYLGNFIPPENINTNINSKLGGAFVHSAGYVDVAKFLSEANEYLQNHIVYEKFEHHDVIFEDDKLIYKDFYANQCVFSEGWMVKNNPYFNYLPMVPAKGEILTIKAEQLQLNEIANAGCFVLPLGDNLYRVGSTYNWDLLDEETTSEAKEELINKLESIIKTNYQIIDHKAGVRPSVKDRRPVLGRHPKFNQLSIFNGMGTKAIMLAPYFSDHLLGHLLNNELLNHEVDIKRFKNYE
jgi:glycine oxidase